MADVYCHFVVMLADFIACRLMELFLLWVWVADGIATVLCNTSSHICGRWYLPMFLLRDGSLTLMNRASLIALVKVLVLPSNYAEVVDISFMT